MRGARGRETATKRGARGASGTPGASAHTTPAPPALMSEDAGAELFHFSLFLIFVLVFFFPFPPNQPVWWGIMVLLFLVFFFFFSGLFFFFCLNIWKILHPLRSDKEKREKKKSLNETKPKEPIFDLGSRAGR